MKKWETPDIIGIELRETANSNQPDMPNDGLYQDYYTVCSTCS